MCFVPTRLPGLITATSLFLAELTLALMNVCYQVIFLYLFTELRGAIHFCCARVLTRVLEFTWATVHANTTDVCDVSSSKGHIAHHG